MRRLFAIFVVMTSLAMTTPVVAGTKVFKESSDFTKDSEVKGYLNTKFDTYAKMYECPKGTDCDWVFRAEDFNLADLRTRGALYFAGGLAAGSSGNPYLDYGVMQAFYGNGLAASFESTVMGMGVQLTRPNAQKPADDPTRVDQGKVAGLKAKQEADLTGMDLEMEKALFGEDKAKVGVSAAVKNANLRKAERHATLQAQIDDLEKKLSANKPASNNPEDQKGYVIVLYLMDSGMNTGSVIFSPIATNSTTAEFIILKDGKPVLAGRHSAVSTMWGSSSNKCGQKLASAFNIKG